MGQFACLVVDENLVANDLGKVDAARGMELFGEYPWDAALDHVNAATDEDEMPPLPSLHFTAEDKSSVDVACTGSGRFEATLLFTQSVSPLKSLLRFLPFLFLTRFGRTSIAVEGITHEQTRELLHTFLHTGWRAARDYLYSLKLPGTICR